MSHDLSEPKGLRQNDLAKTQEVVTLTLEPMVKGPIFLNLICDASGGQLHCPECAFSPESMVMQLFRDNNVLLLIPNDSWRFFTASRSLQTNCSSVIFTLDAFG